VHQAASPTVLKVDKHKSCQNARKALFASDSGMPQSKVSISADKGMKISTISGPNIKATSDGHLGSQSEVHSLAQCLQG
jgi:hypothetical protein